MLNILTKTLKENKEEISSKPLERIFCPTNPPSRLVNQLETHGKLAGVAAADGTDFMRAGCLAEDTGLTGCWVRIRPEILAGWDCGLRSAGWAGSQICWPARGWSHWLRAKEMREKKRK
ncbi:hypothetical protein TIFTF001_039750 [Ficus carica]|uniref:Uncharacterized protein n=1 Tax=Ficus carica TaxID=3494 RepID=A0AA87YW97_FICCA|nr:hypothetical protein TIFTF001_039750 [Ficus carica]